MSGADVAATWVTQEARGPVVRVRGYQLEVVSGPDQGLRREVAAPAFRVGAGPGNDLRLADRRVSGAHLEIELDRLGYRLRDLASTNGTTIGGVRIADAYLTAGAMIGLGRSLIRFTPGTAVTELPLHPESRFGQLIGPSPSMRRMFHELAQIAPSDVTVLIHGETGTGKELVAEAIHDASARAAGPLVVIDCGGIPGNLFENELFGHERGAFTGADRAAAGAFERADGGTLFLDELGELPLDLQPKLLRAVQERVVRRLGSAREIPVDVRIVAATHRDLAVEVNRGTFREDLFYRLAVARIEVPPLRERRDDILPLIHHFLAAAGAGAERLTPDAAVELAAHYWPGNVRELRTAVERLLIAPTGPLYEERPAPAPADALHLAFELDLGVAFKDAKQQVIDEFDRRFLEALLARHGNIAAAARATGLDRVSIYKIMSRLGLRKT
jgi:two-component system response regulator GlrR